ncbi:hypothetical protein ACEYYA_11025 [Paracoccus sp. p3-h83]|uniref:hypothetical protein n=1 Tax=Paracoccus sp. p3-h83 TaxID=3342805 RepID=UPI0035B91D2F
MSHVVIHLPVAPNLCAYARKLLADGADPDALTFVYRGETLCFKPAPLGAWARLTTEEGDRSIRFRTFRPSMGRRVGAKPAGGAEGPPEGEGAAQDEG